VYIAPSLTNKTNDMTRSEEVQKAKDLLRSVGYHVSWWSVVDVTEDYDVTEEEAQHCLESVLHGELITDMVKEEINEFAYENDYKINN
jgi:hypothetical protein